MRVRWMIRFKSLPGVDTTLQKFKTHVRVLGLTVGVEEVGQSKIASKYMKIDQIAILFNDVSPAPFFVPSYFKVSLQHLHPPLNVLVELRDVSSYVGVVLGRCFGFITRQTEDNYVAIGLVFYMFELNLCSGDPRF